MESEPISEDVFSANDDEILVNNLHDYNNLIYMFVCDKYTMYMYTLLTLRLKNVLLICTIVYFHTCRPTGA